MTPAARDAADSLAEVLRSRAAASIVLAVPRGGVPIGAEIANALDRPFDLWLARDVPAGFHRERVLGGISEASVPVFDEHERASLDEVMVHEVVRRERRMLRHDAVRFRGAAPPPDVRGVTAILVEEAIATPWRMLAAVRDLLARGAREVIIAAPVIAASAVAVLERDAGAIACVSLATEDTQIVRWCAAMPLVTDREIQLATAYAAFSVVG